MNFSRRGFLTTATTVASGFGLGLNSNLGSMVNATNPTRLTRDDILKERTRESMLAVQRGMEWIKKGRNKRSGGYGVDKGHKDDIGCTAVVGLAMLGDGSTPSQGPNKQALRDIVNFLLKRIRVMPATNITSEKGTQLQRKIGEQAHTFFALLFLTQVAGEAHIPKETLTAARKVIDAVAKAQRPDGSWGNESWAPTLGTVMGWTSLRSSHFAGFEVGASPEKTSDYLIGKMKKEMGQNRGHWMHQLYKNAAGIRVLYAMGKEDDAIVKKSFKEVLKLVKDGSTAFNQAGGEEYLAFHLITETMLQKAGEDWSKWFPVVRDKIIKVQNQDGSWVGHHCITSRTFCTAAACLVLSAPNRYLPISQQ